MALELLDMTALPIGDIGRAVAFALHGAFIAAFRRWTGMTPRAWRARPTAASPSPSLPGTPLPDPPREDVNVPHAVR
jgi:AraC-like DNA-binding protein